MTCVEEERVVRREVPREPEQPVRRMVWDFAGGYARVVRGGQEEISAVREVRMRDIVSVEVGFVGIEIVDSRVEGGEKARTSCEIEGFSKRVLREIGRERRMEREVRRESAVSELMPRS